MPDIEGFAALLAASYQQSVTLECNERVQIAIVFGVVRVWFTCKLTRIRTIATTSKSWIVALLNPEHIFLDTNVCVCVYGLRYKSSYKLQAHVLSSQLRAPCTCRVRNAPRAMLTPVRSLAPRAAVLHDATSRALHHVFTGPTTACTRPLLTSLDVHNGA